MTCCNENCRPVREAPRDRDPGEGARASNPPRVPGGRIVADGLVSPASRTNRARSRGRGCDPRPEIESEFHGIAGVSLEYGGIYASQQQAFGGRERVGSGADADGKAGADPAGELALERFDLFAEHISSAAEDAGERFVDLDGQRAVAAPWVGLRDRDRRHGQKWAPQRGLTIPSRCWPRLLDLARAAEPQWGGGRALALRSEAWRRLVVRAASPRC